MSMISQFGDGSRMIGYATWHGGKTRLELWGVNKWRALVNGVLDPVLAQDIATIYSDRMLHHGPGDGEYGYAVLSDLALSMGGTFVFNKADPLPAGVVS